MRIIVLQGMPNKGKTNTIWLVRNLLLNNGGNPIPNEFQIFGNNQIQYKDDFKDIINYNGMKVALCSMGDYSIYLANAVYDYDRQGCDVLVCALSTNNAKVRANNALNQFNTTRINKTIAPNRNNPTIENTADAQTIFNLL
jgi:hypothetical protein